ncbi:hypothetical protein QQF64_033461 [Cirrhinus molitorella]|uniref:Uncharacterized protein n=1 Tax=Cirrhinus molitorella TaxID=172907 RepID=A0ABR3MTZ1_9TELE
MSAYDSGSHALGEVQAADEGMVSAEGMNEDSHKRERERDRERQKETVVVREGCRARQPAWSGLEEGENVRERAAHPASWTGSVNGLQSRYSTGQRYATSTNLEKNMAARRNCAMKG